MDSNNIAKKEIENIIDIIEGTNRLDLSGFVLNGAALQALTNLKLKCITDKLTVDPENTTPEQFQIMHHKLDYQISFCEYLIQLHKNNIKTQNAKNLK